MGRGSCLLDFTKCNFSIFPSHRKDNLMVLTHLSDGENLSDGEYIKMALRSAERAI